MNYHTVLGVPISASQEEIKKAYRRLASMHHPDKGGDAKRFQEIQRAYDVLSSSKSGVYVKRNRAYTLVLNITLEQCAIGSSETVSISTDSGNKLIQITIPQGINDGEQVSYDNVLPDGILNLIFKISKHHTFERSNLDLFTSKEINILTLLTGSKFVMKDIYGADLEVNIPELTKPYTKLRISNRGLKKYGKIGDMYVLIVPVMPAKISQELVKTIQSELSK